MNEGIYCAPRKLCVARAFYRLYRPFIALVLMAAGCLLFACVDARSATETWNPNGAGGGNGTWDTGIIPYWNSGVNWTNSNDALFTGTGGTVTVVNPIANSLTFSASGPYLLESGTLTLSGNDVIVNSNATISSELNSTVGLTKTGMATLTLTGSDNLGTQLNSGGIVDVESGTLAIQNGGTVSANVGYIGYNGGSNGSVTVSGAGSTWANQLLWVGYSGAGSLLINNGAAVSDTFASIGMGDYIGYGAGSSGVVTVSGSGSTWSDNGGLWVGNSGSGTLLVTNGGGVTVTAVGSYGYGIAIGSSSSSGTGSGIVTVTGSGSSFDNKNSFLIGNGGTGTLLITDGASVSTDDNLLNETLGPNYSSIIGGYSSGTATVSGSGSSWSNESMMFVGYSGNGTLLITNGGTVSDGVGFFNPMTTEFGGTILFMYGSAVIGNGSGVSGTVTVSGSGSSWTNSNNVYVGWSGTGTVLVTDGGAVSDNSAYLGYNGGLERHGDCVRDGLDVDHQRHPLRRRYPNRRYRSRHAADHRWRLGERTADRRLRLGHACAGREPGAERSGDHKCRHGDAG